MAHTDVFAGLKNKAQKMTEKMNDNNLLGELNLKVVMEHILNILIGNKMKKKKTRYEYSLSSTK